MSYLYLMKRTTNHSFLSYLTMQYEVKIGISKTPLKRNKSVNRSTKGSVILIMQMRFRDPKKYEGILHDMFDCSRFAMKKKRGQKSNGHKEWFYLNPLELITVRLWIWWWKVKPYFITTIVLL